MSSPSLAVVLATHNRPEGLRRCLDALAKQQRQPDEIVVVDDASTAPVVIDGPVGAVPVTLLRNERPQGAAASRNRGWRAARAEHILFTDDDCRPSPSWVDAMAHAMRPDVIAVGRTLPDPEDRPQLTPLDRSLQVERSDGTFATANIGIPRSALEALGGFDETFLLPYGEDTDLGQRALAAGLRDEYVDSALVHHAVHRQSFRQALAERRRVAELARLAATYRHLRDEPWDGVFWNRDHRLLVTAAACVAAVPVAVRGARRADRGSFARKMWIGASAAGLAPAARYAYWCRRRALELAPDHVARNALVWFALDAAEVAVLAAGSVRYRTLFL